LLHAIFEEARRQGYAEVRLEVAGSNHRARALYERIGFVPVTQVDMGLLRHVFGFDSTTTMICRVV
ncbi:MAG: GNAT family N-acetyltransferase, partial [Marivivens sp.]